MTRSLFLLVAGALLAVPLCAQTPQLRGGVLVVPVDVRVVDRQGNPVADLTESDFTILENAQPQSLRHFSTVDLNVAAAAGLPAGPLTPDALLESPTRRVFLLVLGRGRLQPPSKGADAAIAFVRNHVLPRDYVGVIAWGRATSFTTDHAKTVGLLERFKRGHEKIESHDPLPLPAGVFAVEWHARWQVQEHPGARHPTRGARSSSAGVLRPPHPDRPVSGGDSGAVRPATDTND